MTAEAGEFAGHAASTRRARAVVAALEAQGAHPRDGGVRPHGPVLAALRRARRAAHLAAVVHADGRARRARGGGRALGPHPHPPGVPAAPLPRLARRDPPVVHLAPALVGPPDPRLVPRRGALRRHRAARGRGLGARPRRARHVVLVRACGRSRRSAGRRTRPQLRAFYPTDVLSTARDILFLWVARMVMLGLRFTGEIPFSDVYCHSVIQAPDGRRMSKSLGTGVDPLDLIDGGPRPAAMETIPPTAATSRPTAPTRCASACWPCPPARTCASARRRSRRARRS